MVGRNYKWIDKYSLTPLLSLKSAFELKKINVFQDLLQKDMGLKKMDHIGEILKDKRIIHKWEYKHGKKPDENDKYEELESPLLMRISSAVEPSPIL